MCRSTAVEPVQSGCDLVNRPGDREAMVFPMRVHIDLWDWLPARRTC